eukprot:UN2817
MKPLLEQASLGSEVVPEGRQKPKSTPSASLRSRYQKHSLLVAEPMPTSAPWRGRSKELSTEKRKIQCGQGGTRPEEDEVPTSAGAPPSFSRRRRASSPNSAPSCARGPWGPWSHG